MENKKKKAKGILPPYSWLMKNGFGGLSNCMRKYPEMFAHIEQEYNGGKSLEEWVVVAEEMEKELGQVPCPSQLRENHPGLIVFMKKYPSEFSHIKQEWRGGRSLEESVKYAEQLEKTYGELPHPHWLVTNEESALAHIMIKNPDAFAHIKQKSKKGRSLKESIEYAEEIASLHGGVLPSQKWMSRNGESALYATIKRFPNKFKHIPMMTEFPSVEEAVLKTEEIIKEEGCLPTLRELRKRGLSWIIRHMYKQPEMFKHIRRKNPQRRTVEENVELAEKIAEKNGGILPGRGVLSTTGYCGISLHIRKYPEMFAHIKQEYKGGRSLGENVILAKKIEKEKGALPHDAWLNNNGLSGLKACIRSNPQEFEGIKQVFYYNMKKGVRTIGEE